MGNFMSELRRNIHYDNPKAVRLILEEAGEGSPDLINEDYTADCFLDVCRGSVYNTVHTAVFLGHLDVLEVLLQYGGDPDVPSRDYARTALHHAARLHDPDAVAILLQYGADVHATDCFGSLPIHYAAEAPASRMLSQDASVETLRHLVRAGEPEDVDARDSFGETPLHHAVQTGNWKAVTYLMKHGAQPDVVNNAGKTPRDMASSKFASLLEKS